MIGLSNKLSKKFLVISGLILVIMIMTIYQARKGYLNHQKNNALQQLQIATDKLFTQVSTIKKTLHDFTLTFNPILSNDVQNLKETKLEGFKELFFIKKLSTKLNLDEKIFSNKHSLERLLETTSASAKSGASKLFIDAKTNECFTWFSSPCYKDNKLIGIILGKVPLTELLKNLETSIDADDIFIAQNINGNVSLIKYDSDLKPPHKLQNFLLSASLGQSTSVLKDSRTNATIFASAYETILSIGIVMSKNENTISFWFYFFMLLFGIALIYIILTLLYRSYYIVSEEELLLDYKSLKPIHLILIISALGLIIAIFFINETVKLHKLVRASTSEMLNKHDLLNEFIAEKINTTLFEIIAATKILSDELQENKIDHVEKIINDIYAVNEHICAVKINDKKTATLNGIWVKTKNGIQKQKLIIDTYDQTKQIGWNGSYFDETVHKMVVAFNATTKNSAYEITVLFEIAGIEKIVNNLRSFLLRNLTVTDAEENDVFMLQIPTKTKRSFLFAEKTTRSKHLTIPNWHLETTHSVDKMTMPFDKIRQILIIMLIAITMFFCLMVFLYHIEKGYKFIQSTNFINALLVSCNLLLWLVIYVIPHIDFNNVGQIINDKIASEKFVTQTKSINENLQFKHPEITYVGLLLQSVDLSQANHAQINAFLWHRSTNPKTDFGLMLLDCQQQKMHEILSGFRGGFETKMWSLSANVTSLDDFTLYPFAIKHFKVKIAPEQFNTTMMLCPSDTMLAANATPWVSPALKTPGFTLEETFMSAQYLYDSTLTNISETQNNMFIFNYIFRESLLGALFSYVLPLIIILFFIFGLLWINPDFRFTSYSGTFFAIVLLHRNLRTSLNITSICYLEYFFLYVYIFIIVLMGATLLELFKPEYFKPYENIVKRSFWPVQFLLWIITTGIMFY